VIRYDTIEEFNVDSKAVYSALSSTRSQKRNYNKQRQWPFNTVQVKIREVSPENKHSIFVYNSRILTNLEMRIKSKNAFYLATLPSSSDRRKTTYKINIAYQSVNYYDNYHKLC